MSSDLPRPQLLPVSYAIEISETLAPGSWIRVKPDIDDAHEISCLLPGGENRIFARLVVRQNP